MQPPCSLACRAGAWSRVWQLGVRPLGVRRGLWWAQHSGVILTLVLLFMGSLLHSCHTEVTGSR